MRYAITTLLALALGGLAGHEMWRVTGINQDDPVQIVMTQLRTHAVIEQERQLGVWYRVCPTVLGKTPQIFMAWPVRLTYQIELGNVQVSREGTVIRVKTSPIHSVEPSIPTDFIDYMSTESIFTFANEQELVNHEIAKATPVARYLTTYFMAHDPSLLDDFRQQMESLVEHFTSALGIRVTRVDVEIPPIRITSWPRLPRIELCAGTLASVNGLPFAKFDLGTTIPIGFRIEPHEPLWNDDGPPAQMAPGNLSPMAIPRGIASVMH